MSAFTREMREYWRGSAEAWECDEMGHMNVRFWVRHCLDGIIVLAEDIGCSGAFARGATATLLPKRQHIKFMREARAGAPLFSRGGIVSVSDAEITFYCELVHSFSGEIGATFITTLAHVDAKTGKAFPFPPVLPSSARRSRLRSHPMANLALYRWMAIWLPVTLRQPLQRGFAV